MRNFGVAIAHSYLAIQSAERGISKLAVDREALSADLEEAWAVLAEAVQTVMRKHHLPGAYEQLKALTRGQSISRADLHDFIGSLDIPHEDRQMLLQLKPDAYTGRAAQLALEGADGQ